MKKIFKTFIIFIRFLLIRIFMPGLFRYIFLFFFRLVILLLIVVIPLWVFRLTDLVYILGTKNYMSLLDINRFTMFSDYFSYWTSTLFDDAIGNYDDYDLKELIARYQIEQDNIEEELDSRQQIFSDVNKIAYTKEIGVPGYAKESQQVEFPAAPPFLHFEIPGGYEDPNEFQQQNIIDENIYVLLNDFEARQNMISSVERYYRDGFFDYGYKYEDDDIRGYSPPIEIDTEEYNGYTVMEKEDYHMEDMDYVYDDNTRPRLYKSGKLAGSPEYDSAKKIINRDRGVLGLENIHNQFVRYVNNYAIDYYEDLADLKAESLSSTGGNSGGGNSSNSSNSGGGDDDDDDDDDDYIDELVQSLRHSSTAEEELEFDEGSVVLDFKDIEDVYEDNQCFLHNLAITLDRDWEKQINKKDTFIKSLTAMSPEEEDEEEGEESGTDDEF